VVLSAAAFIMMMFPFHREIAVTSVVSIGSLAALILGRLAASHAKYIRVCDDIERYGSYLLTALFAGLVVTLYFFFAAEDIIERASGFVLALMFVMYRVFVDIRAAQSKSVEDAEPAKGKGSPGKSVATSSMPVYAQVRVTGHRIASDGNYAEFCVTTTHPSLSPTLGTASDSGQLRVLSERVWML
jgi:hypothetical protein